MVPDPVQPDVDAVYVVDPAVPVVGFTDTDPPVGAVAAATLVPESPSDQSDFKNEVEPEAGNAWT